MNKFLVRGCLAVIVGLTLIASASAAPVTLEGMNQILQWTDTESVSDEMPGFIWGTSDGDGADRIGIHVLFANGLEGSSTYSGVAGVWNSGGFAAISADTQTGFMTGWQGIHFLFNNAPTDTYPAALALAWTDSPMAFSNNFDLDYNDPYNGLNSNFRASAAGWGSAVFTTYSSTASAVPEPTLLALLGIGLGMVGLAGSKRRREKTPSSR